MFWLVFGFTAMALLFVSGSPLFVSFAVGGGLLSALYAGIPFSSIAGQLFGAVNKELLVAVPMFILAGNLMTLGGPSRTLVEFMKSLVGRMRGGLLLAAVLACTFFAALSGSTIATALAVGTMIIPELKRAGYSGALATATTAAAGTLGIMIPPSVAMIILGDVTGASVGKMFIAGILPGLLCAFLLGVTAIWLARREKTALQPSWTWLARWHTFVKALPALAMPVIILGGIYGGVFTPTEAGAVSVGWALICGLLVYRELNLKRLWEVLRITAVSVGAIYYIIAASVLFGIILTYIGAPQAMTKAAMQSGLSPVALKFMFLALLFVMGMLADAFVIYYVVVPLVLPLSTYMGLDLVSFGIFIVMMVMIGQVTPPVAVTLYASCSAAKEPVAAVATKMWPYVGAMTVCAAILILVPDVSLILLRWMHV